MKSMGNIALKPVYAIFLTAGILCGLLLFDNAVPVLAQTADQIPAFNISIVASINNYSSTCIFGVNHNSTIAYSSEYDSIATYPSSGGVYCYVNYMNSSLFKPLKLAKYIVPSNGSTIWHLEVESIDQEGILTINWSSGTPLGNLTFVDGIINKIVYADMNAVSSFSYTATAGGVSDFDIIFQSATNTTPTPTSSVTPTPTTSPISSPSPTIPEFPLWIVLPIISMFTVAALVYFRRIKKQKYN